MKKQILKPQPGSHTIALILGFCFVFLSHSYAQSCYKRLSDVSGITPTQKQLDALESAACRLIDSLPVAYQDSFKVFDFGFYLHNESMIDGYPSVFKMALDEIKDNNTKYYFLFGRQTDSTGINTKFWVDLHLPDSDIFYCMDKISPSFRNNLVIKYGFITNETYKESGKVSDRYYDAEIASMDSLINFISKTRKCCLGPGQQKSEISCEIECGFTPEQIKQTLIENGYVSFPIEILNSLAAKEKKLKLFENVNFPLVDDWASLIYKEGEYNRFAPSFLQIEMEKESYGGAKVRAFVTKNENFCLKDQCAFVKSKFISEHLDYSIHCHLWENPSSSEDLMFVKFFYNTTPPSTGQVESFQPNNDNCEPIPLPINSSKTYAVAIDPSDGKFHGYTKVGSNWIKGEILEYEFYKTKSDDIQLKYGNRGAKIKNDITVTSPEGYTYTIPSYYPSYDVYLWAEKEPQNYPTSDLVDLWWKVFVDIGGSLETSKLRSSFIAVANHFKYGQGKPFGFYCNPVICTYVKNHENLRNILLPRLDQIFSTWLQTHPNLEGLFTQPNNPLELTPYEYFLTPIWSRAIIGGQQGVSIKIKKFEQINDYYYIDVIFSVLDTFGVGDDDAEDGGIIQQILPYLRPGLKALWVLQHYRNYDTSYCPEGLTCFCPIPKLYFTILSKRKIKVP